MGDSGRCGGRYCGCRGVAAVALVGQPGRNKSVFRSSRCGFASLLNSLKIGERIAVYSYDTYLEAYIDLSELTADDVEVDRKNRFVRLRLPAVHTRFTGRDMEVKAEVENNSEYRRLITDEARAKAVGFFTALLRERGYESEVTVAAN